MKADTNMQNERPSLFEELRRLSPKVTGGLLRMRQEAFREGAVPAKYKILTALAISIAIRCAPCIRAYVQQAWKAGVTREELVEFLEVAMTMQGCPGEEWALKAFAAYLEFTQSGKSEEDPTCCIHEVGQTE